MIQPTAPDPLLQALLDAIPYPFLFKDLQGCFLGCNQAFAADRNLTRQELLGKTAYDLLPPDEARMISVQDQELAHSGGRQSILSRVTFPVRGVRQVLVHKAAFRDPDGSPAGIAATIVDVTEQKEAEEALRRSQDLLASISRHVTDLMAILDKDGKRLYFSPSCQTVLGYSREELEAAAPLALVHPEDRNLHRQALANVFGRGAPQVTESRLRHRDGHWLHFESRTDPIFDAAGVPCQALALLGGDSPWAVIVSDQRMPGMDATELLSRVKERSPDTTRIMLTGNADQATAMEAVNRGAIFRFLTKPCASEVLVQALEAGIRQYELVTAERQLLEQTLKGSLAMLVELLGVLDPISFGRAQTMAALAEGLARDQDMPAPWIMGIASILSQIGILTVPGALVTKIHTGGFLNSSEREIANLLPEIGSNLLRHIPRLEPVAEAILYMNKNYNGTGFPTDPRRGADIPLGGRILRVAADYLNLLGNQREPRAALEEMECRSAWYDLSVLRSLARVIQDLEPAEPETQVQELSLRDLRLDHRLAGDIRTRAGMLLVPAGTRLGLSHLEKLRNFARLGGIREPIAVLTSGNG